MTATDQSPAKSTVLGRPILLALEDIDGTPSFLEKALRYVEDHGKMQTLFLVRIEWFANFAGLFTCPSFVNKSNHRYYVNAKVHCTLKDECMFS